MKLLNTYMMPFVVNVALIVLLSVCGNATAADGKAAPSAEDTISYKEMEAYAERMRQLGKQIQDDAVKARARREAMEAQQAAMRKKEAEQARAQAARDAAQLAAIKDANKRRAAEAAQAQARQEANERAAKAEAERQAAIKAQQALDEQAARELAAKEKAVKEQLDKLRKDKPHLGTEPKWGVDL
jgi:colicin import membrane protein